MSIKFIKICIVIIVFQLIHCHSLTAQNNTILNSNELKYYSSKKLNDSKIVLAGQYGKDAIITKYIANGTIDNSFGKNGSVIIQIENAITCINSIQTQSNGNILAVGFINYNDFRNNNQLILRILADGKLDETFGNKGFVIKDFSNNSNESLNSIVVNKDNSFYVGGNTDFIGNVKGTIARYTDIGKIDSNFGVFGFIYVSINDLFDEALVDLNLQDDGQIVSTILIKNKENYHLVHKRYYSSGLLDNKLNTGNPFFWQLKNSEECTSKPFISMDGKLVIGGINWNLLNNNMTLNINEDPNNLNNFNGTSYIIEPNNESSNQTLFHYFTNSNMKNNHILLSNCTQNGSIFFNQVIDDYQLLSESTLARQAKEINYIPEFNCILCDFPQNNNISSNYTSTRVLSKLSINTSEINYGYNNLLIYSTPISTNQLFEFNLVDRSNVMMKLYDQKGKYITTLFEYSIKNVGKYEEKIQFPKNLKDEFYYLEYINRNSNILIQVKIKN